MSQSEEELEQRVDELEDTVEFLKQAIFELEDAAIGDYGTAQAGRIADERGSIIERVEALEAGEIDTSAIAADRDQLLPIQRMTDDRKSGAHDLDGNKLRATYVWPEFQKRAIPEAGKLKLTSSQVKNIHQEHDLDTNSNTIKRTMEMVAKYTSEKAEAEMDAYDEDNPVTMQKRTGKNVLVADKDEWDARMAQLEEHLEGKVRQPTDDVSDQEAEAQTEPVTATADQDAVEKRLEALANGTAVTTADQNSVTSEISTTGEDITLS